MFLINIFVEKRNRQLLLELTKKEIKQRYKQSVLGYFWVILAPALQMMVMSFVFQFIFKPGDIGVPYSIFLFAGLLPWTLFSNSLASATNALVDGAGLIKKIYFPREILILSTILAKNVDFFLSSIVFVVMMIVYGIPAHLTVLWIVVILLIQNLFTFGLSLITATLNLFYRDIQYLLSLIVLLWMYLTPIMYSTEIFPEKYRWIFKINPMAVFVNAYRESILSGGMPNLISLGIGLLLSLLLLIVGYKLFRRLEGQFADAV